LSISAERGTVAVVTGSSGLIGAESVRQFSELGLDVVGIDNDQRRLFFGDEASTHSERVDLERAISRYRHIETDIRDITTITDLFSSLGNRIAVVIHAAAQPSHDWAAVDPAADFAINASGTLGLLNCCLRFCPNAPFIFMSTNKVYGDNPNRLPLVELKTRWELAPEHHYFSCGIDEQMSIDQCNHSIFGVSKVAADLMVQEFGRRFGLSTVCFRAGCITGPRHRGTFLHGFLSHLCRSVLTSRAYTVVGHKGKQVRDNLHCSDLVSAFRAYCAAPKIGAVYNIGGGREAACSILEALEICEEFVGREIERRFEPQPRFGDHVWWISDATRFRTDFPCWKASRDALAIISELLAAGTVK
jgi:CDP-paratose 2-epimerase